MWGRWGEDFGVGFLGGGGYRLIFVEAGRGRMCVYIQVG